MSSYSEIFSNTWAFVLVLLFFGGSIFVHEFGHFLAAKLRGLKVLRFSIGFGPRLFSWKGKDGCKYMVSLLPLGGYVALPQLADMGALEGEESDDDTTSSKLPSATATDKIIVSAAGAFFNILFAVVLASIVWVIGIPEPITYSTTTIGSVSETISDAMGNEIPSPAFLKGVKEGDKIIEIDGKKVSNFMDIIELVAIGSGRDDKDNPQVDILVERDGKKINFKLSPVLVSTNTATNDKIRMIGVAPKMDLYIGSVMDNSPAKKAGLQIGDRILAVNGIKLFSNVQLSKYLDKLADNSTAELLVKRGESELKISVKPQRIELTKNLCIVETPNQEGSLSFITSGSDDGKNSTIKLFKNSAKDNALSELEIGAVLYAIDDTPVHTVKELNLAVNKPATKPHIKLSFLSDGAMRDVYLPTASSSKIQSPKAKMMLGCIFDNPMTVSHPNIAAQFSESLSRTYNAISSLVNPRSDIGISSLAGPVDIGRVIYKLSLSDISLVLSFAVLLNINLAILNMLPIPVLDGGHIMFAIIERIRRKPLPPEIFAVVQGLFSVLFISLMIYVVYIGFARWKGDSDMEANDKIRSEYYINKISFK